MSFVIKNFVIKHVKKIVCIISCILMIVLLCSGCGRNVSVLKGETMEESSTAEQTNEKNVQENIENNLQNSLQNNIDTVDQQENKSQESEFEDIQTTEAVIYIDLGGAVNNPGVYSLPEGSRVFELIALAGGFAENAYTRQINQADVLSDGQQIYVYTIQEAEDLFAQGIWSDTTWDAAGTSDNASNSNSNANASSGKVNLNLASKEDLMTLTGIGETRAEAILQYRQEHGRFSSVEELMQVDGIKEKTYEKIKDCITVQ